MKATSFMRWMDGELKGAPDFRRKVSEALAELRVEQDLIRLRESRGYSQKQLARMLGVSQPAIAKLESGRAKNIGLGTLVRTAAALGGKVRIEIEKEPRVPHSSRLALTPRRSRTD